MSAPYILDGSFDAGHGGKDTEFRSSMQAELRKPVITERRFFRDDADMAEKRPSDRAVAFKEWMKARETNTKQVALRAGVPYTTLASFVQGGTQSLKGDTEEKISAVFGESPHLIFSGPGRADGRAILVRIIGRVGADASGSVIMATAHETWDMVPLAPGATSKAVALSVQGDSMHTFAENGALIYFEDQRAPLDPELIGVPCVVETEDGRVLVKRPRRGSEPGLYDLESDYGPVIRDVRLTWAAEIIAVVPPRQARRIIIKAAELA